MANYDNNEYVEMVICYGLGGENAAEAARVYAERYPGARHPNPRTILVTV